jgi:hypothetical protein
MQKYAAVQWVDTDSAAAVGLLASTMSMIFLCYSLLTTKLPLQADG